MLESSQEDLIVVNHRDGYVALCRSGETVFFVSGHDAKPYLEASLAGEEVLRRKIMARLSRRRFAA